MTNRQAAWKNEATLELVNDWWASYSGEVVDSLEGLFRRYYYWITSAEVPEFGLNIGQFAKCLTAIRVLHLGGGVWRQAAEWQPSADYIRRMTSDEQ